MWFWKTYLSAPKQRGHETLSLATLANSGPAGVWLLKVMSDTPSFAAYRPSDQAMNALSFPKAVPYVQGTWEGH